MWNSLLISVCLMMVVEGIWPFLDPAGMRDALINFANQDDQTIRVAGLVMMVVGVLLLYIVN